MRDRQLREWNALVRERADAERCDLPDDVVDELACYFADMQAAALRNGGSETDARRRALDALTASSFLELSKRPPARPSGGHMRNSRLTHGLWEDVRYGLRRL